MSTVSHDGLLAEQRQLEATIARIRWGAVALTIALGPTFPNLSLPGVVLLGVLVAAYNVVTGRLSAASRDLEQHRRVAEATFALDLIALSIAMLLFSVDPYWTTFVIGPLVIIGGAFRFGAEGAYVSATVLGLAYVAISVFRARAFDLPFEPQRMAFHLSVFGLTALLIDRVLRDARQVRAQREELIDRLERRVEEDAAIGSALRVVARGPGRALVPAVLEASRAVFHFDRATVFVEDQEASEYVPVHRLAAEDAPPSPRMRIGEGLLGSAFAAGSALLVEDVLGDPRYVPRPAGEEARSVIVVPLSIGGRLTAALTLSRARPAFGSDDLRLAETVGGLIAQLMDNERLFAEASEAEALRELDRLKDEFLAAVSHELRTPLTVIAGSLELMAGRPGELSERSQRLVEQAERHVQRLQRHVEDLLDLAQLQEAKIELQREFTSPEAILLEVATTNEPLATPRGQRIVVDRSEVPPVLVDRRRMQQIVGNLVHNATRYAPPGTTISLQTEAKGDNVLFSVSDEGAGVPAADRDRIFDKFYRGEVAKSAASGSGLGLAIARTLVELHGGRIWVEAAPSGGARFVVSVPVEPVLSKAAVG